MPSLPTSGAIGFADVRNVWGLSGAVGAPAKPRRTRAEEAVDTKPDQA